MIQLHPATTRQERRLFLTFPWRIYKGDLLWVPPLLPERARVIDPQQGLFYRGGHAELFIAWQNGRPVGTFSLAEDYNNTRAKGYKECVYGFVECINDYAVFKAMFDYAAAWARAHNMKSLYGPYNLDREDSRGILVEGRNRPPTILCAHHPPYYQQFFEQYGFQKDGEDGLAYAASLDPGEAKIQRLAQLAEKVRRRHPEFSVRSANLAEREAEIDRILSLQNRALGHLPGFIPYTRSDIESMILPLLDLVDTELVLFAEVNGQPAGFFPGVPNFNEILIHLNGLRYPWDYLRALRFRKVQPKCIAIKSVVVPPEYWDTGVAVLLFDEMVRRAVARNYTWADLSLTGEDNPDTWPLAHHIGAKIYKRYRFYRKEL